MYMYMYIRTKNYSFYNYSVVYFSHNILFYVFFYKVDNLCTKVSVYTTLLTSF